MSTNSKAIRFCNFCQFLEFGLIRVLRKDNEIPPVVIVVVCQLFVTIEVVVYCLLTA